MTVFKEEVESLVAKVPSGKVVTYGQIAAICGRPRAARIVGGIAHFGNPNLPWHRVVKKDGSLAEGYPGGIPSHQEHLKSENVEFVAGKVKMESHLWQPAH